MKLSSETEPRSASPLPFVILALAAVLITGAVFLPHIRRSFFLFDDFAIVGLAPTFTLRQLLTSAPGNFFRPLAVWLLGFEARAFGWGHPAGFSLVSFVIHAANAALFGAILRTLGFRTVPSAAGSVLFLASPWAGEALFWTSAQFDLLCAFGFLLSAWCGLRALALAGWRRVALLALSCGSAVLSLLSKEMSVTMPVLLLVMAWIGSEPPRKSLARVAPLLGLLVVIVAGYLVLRGRVLPALQGPQGRPLEILKLVHPWSNAASAARTVVLPPHHPFLGRFLPGAALVLLWGATLVAGLLRETRRVSLAAVGFLVSFSPAFFAHFAKGTTNGSRFLYLPGVFVVLLLVSAWRRAGDGAHAGLTFGFVLLVLPGLVWQAQLWDKASELSRSAVSRFATYLPGNSPLHIADLPSVFEEGPYILKTYAFRFYFGDRLRVPVEADALTLRLRDNRLVVLRKAPDDYGDKIPSGAPRQVIRLTSIDDPGR